VFIKLTPLLYYVAPVKYKFDIVYINLFINRDLLTWFLIRVLVYNTFTLSKNLPRYNEISVRVYKG